MQLDNEYTNVLSLSTPEQIVCFLCCGEQHRQFSEDVNTPSKLNNFFDRLTNLQ
jgi:hypothetical protein